MVRRRKRAGAQIEAAQSVVSGESALLGLPDELLELIALRLPAAALVALCACCIRLRGVASADAIWRPLYEADFPRGRTSLEGLPCWRDVYLRAARSLPSAANPDAIGILQFRHQFGFFHPWCVAFDHVRKRMIALNIDVARMLFATGMDGCAVPRAHVRISDAVFAAVDRQSSNCVVVVCSHGQTSVRYLDENFRCTQHPVGITSPRGSFALRPNGRLFLCAADGIYSVDPRSRESRRLLDKGMTSPVVCSSPIAADERDCLVIAHRDGITTFDSEGRHVSTLAVTNVRQLAISRDGIMAVLRRQGDDDDEPVQSEVLFFASNTSESPPLCRYCLPPNYIVGHIVWADERLLVVS
eukprot:TRINITY_DN1181_c0_g1_i1.p1 TRINITY_DN1181_c0_g1~~TRINITY_DN1181_c0_g1_i1.p1  ORF type:complete len:356 (+),score=25.78 TRINITY_DN1181_c0_g1_i1:144-1211(+)